MPLNYDDIEFIKKEIAHLEDHVSTKIMELQVEIHEAKMELNKMQKNILQILKEIDITGENK